MRREGRRSSWNREKWQDLRCQRTNVKQLAFCVILSGGCLGRGSGYLILTSADLYPTMIIPAAGEVREKKNECEVGVIIEGAAEEMG